MDIDVIVGSLVGAASLLGVAAIPLVAAREARREARAAAQRAALPLPVRFPVQSGTQWASHRDGCRCTLPGCR